MNNATPPLEDPPRPTASGALPVQSTEARGAVHVPGQRTRPSNTLCMIAIFGGFVLVVVGFAASMIGIWSAGMYRPLDADTKCPVIPFARGVPTSVVFEKQM